MKIIILILRHILFHKTPVLFQEPQRKSAAFDLNAFRSFL